MRRSTIVLLIVGVLLLAGAAATRFLAYPAVNQLPADYDKTAVYSGTGTFLNASALQSGNAADALLADQNVTVNRHVRVASTNDSTAVVDDDISGKLTNGTTVLSLDHTWAIDRKTMLAASAPSGVTVDPHQGITIGFPIGVKPQNYTYWDSNTQQAVPARYLRTENYQGRNAFVFAVNVSGQVKDPKLLASLPPALPKPLLESLAPLLPPAAQGRLKTLAPSLPAQIPMTYTSANVQTAWIDSATGLPLNVQQQQTVTAGLSVAGAAVPLLPVLQLNIKNTPASVSTAVNDAQNYASGLSFIGTWLPIILLVLGVLFLLLALLMQRRRRPAVSNGYDGPGGPGRPDGPYGTYSADGADDVGGTSRPDGAGDVRGPSGAADPNRPGYPADPNAPTGPARTEPPDGTNRPGWKPPDH
jgi:hypothetical protein